MTRSAVPTPSGQDPRTPNIGRRSWVVLGGLAAFAGVLLFAGPVLAGLGRLILVVVGLTLLLWLGGAILRRVLWRVGRRLVFTYLLVGVLPIVLMTLQVLVGIYLLSGFLLAQVFRSHLHVLSAEVISRASSTWNLSAPPGGPDPRATLASFEHIGVAFYRDGRLQLPQPTSSLSEPRGNETTDPVPELWPQWLADETALGSGSRFPGPLPFLVSFQDGSIRLAAAVGDSESGALAYTRGELAELLSERARIRVDLAVTPERAGDSGSTVAIGNSEWLLRPFRRADVPPPVEEFFHRLGVDPLFYVIGFEAGGRLFDLATAEIVSDDVPATLFAPPMTVARQLFSRSVEIDTQAWVAFLVPAFLLFDLYVVATLMAGLLVWGLSAAINQLSAATGRVQSGDFSVRIPVRRRDQIGTLQQSFNQMTTSLESLVAEAAQKELLEQELLIAAEVQKSLLPGTVPPHDSLEVATYFEPSAAIGGDYFDLLRLHEDRARIAVMIADVTGHGVAAGLRMAMLKAAFEILVREGKQASKILESLDDLVRARREKGGFVTATLSLLDLESGALEITNAGHPPTYLLRRGLVEEIMLPGNPLGALGGNYGRRTLTLQPDDILVWLSDGLIEATDNHDRAFGYERVLAALSGDASSATAVRDRLIDAVRRHSPKEVAEDDQTMVTVRYLG